MTKPLNIALAGSTEHTKICATTLASDPSFSITLVLTPAPRPIGRTQEITPNPLHQFANKNTIPVVLIEQKIDEQIRSQLMNAPQPDFLLVVDFGYIVPDWLLKWPKIAPLNIHPSLLPRWRGSSPGQFVLLYGEKDSAVSIIVMNSQLDQGAIVRQLPFSVSENWTQTEYYRHAFELVAQLLPEILTEFTAGHITATSQSETTPTPIAGRLQKQDSFVPWPLLQQAMKGEQGDFTAAQLGLSSILTAALEHHHSLAIMLYHATYAFQPWPGLWTLIPTSKGEKRMKILQTSLENNKLVLGRVQIEGKTATQWNEVQ